MIPLDYQPDGVHQPKVARLPTEIVTEKQAWLGMLWYLLFFAVIGIILGVLRTGNL